MDDYKRMKENKMNRMKNLTRRLGFCVETNRDNGVLYQSDGLGVMKGVEKKSDDKLLSIGIKRR